MREPAAGALSWAIAIVVVAGIIAIPLVAKAVGIGLAVVIVGWAIWFIGAFLWSLKR